MDDKDLNSLTKEQLIEICKRGSLKIKELEHQNKILNEALLKTNKVLTNINEKNLDTKIKLLMQLASIYYPKSFKTKVKKEDTVTKVKETTFTEEAKTVNKKVSKQIKEKNIRKYKNRVETLKELEKNPLVEVEDRYIDIKDLKCPECGSDLKLEGENIVPKIEVDRIKVRLVKYHIKKYSCSNCDYISTNNYIDEFYGGYASNSLAAYISSSKFAYGLPLYRLEKMFNNQGINITRQMMCKTLINTAYTLERVYDGLTKELKTKDIIHADETTLRVLNLNDDKNRIKSYMYVYSTCDYEVPIAIYKFEKNREAKNSKEFLKGFDGYLVCDDYAGYDNIPNTKLCRCWFHARKKFNELIEPMKRLKISETNGSIAQNAIDKINKIFKADNSIINNEKLSFEEKTKKRNKLVLPLVDSYFKYLKNIKSKTILKLEAAINYSLKIEKDLRRFLEDSRIPTTNNRSERLVKTFVIDRKNFLFSINELGAKTSAIIISLCQTAVLNGIEPGSYIKYLLDNSNDINDKNLSDYYPFSDKVTAELKDKK